MKKTTILLILIGQFTLLFSQNFQLEWQQCYGGSEQDQAKDIVEVPGGYFILGSTKSSDGNISINHGISDGWLIKTDGTGNILWEKTYGGTQGDNFVRIIPDNLGNYIILGASNSSDGDISYDPYVNSWDHWILKIDIEGNIIWDLIVGGSGGETLWTGAPTEDGGIVTIGWTNSNNGNISEFYGGNDTWMIKISSDGELEWDFTIGTDWIDVGQAVLQTSDGGYLAASNSMLLEGGTGNITCIPHTYGWADAVLFKLDADRNIEWQQCYGGSDHDGITALFEIEDGYIFGAYTSSNDGDVSGWHGESDVWIVKIDYDGNIIWQNALGGSRSENTANLLRTSSNEIISFAFTLSNNGDVSGNHSLSEYDADIWMVKLNSEGELLSQQCIGGAGNEELYFGVVKKSDNNFVIAGQTDWGPSYDVQCTPHGNKDYWVFEIEDTSTNVIGQVVSEIGIKVYPNPAKDYIIFEQKGNTINSKIQIVNIFGEEIETIFVKGEKTYPPSASLWRTTWDTRQTKNGIYFYHLEIEEKMVSGKVIVQK